MNLFMKEKKYPKVVEEIHNEFFLASETLLKEAENVLQESKSKDINKGLRLLKLGFKQVGQAVKAKEIETAIVISKADKELVFYYRKNYPLYKFITEEQVKNICHKYNLVCGNVGLFRGFIPERNLIHVENFKAPKGKDTPEYSVVVNENNTNYHPGLLELSNSDKRQIETLKGEVFIMNLHDGKQYYDPINGQYDKIGKCDNSLKICAPIKDMDTTGMENSEGFKIIKISPPDPIVLQPVKGGYLIVTAWGDEASDPDIINPVNN